MTGTIACTVAAFGGDPLFGTVKSCQIQAGQAAAGGAGGTTGGGATGSGTTGGTTGSGQPARPAGPRRRPPSPSAAAA